MTSISTVTIAAMVHSANKAWCELNGDFSQPSWDNAPDWQKSSAMNGVTFHQMHPEAGDSASHDSWMEEKIANGWVYGEDKDPDATPPTHPCIVAFDLLPLVQRKKDAIFRAIVHALLKD